MNPKFRVNWVMKALGELNDYLCYNLPPGKPWIPMHFFVNLNKGTMMIYLFTLMCYYDNFSLGAWVYLGLHGNYGLIWVIKDRTFPDIGFSREATTVSSLFAFPACLFWYYCIGFWMISGGEAQRNPSYERIFVAI